MYVVNISSAELFNDHSLPFLRNIAGRVGRRRWKRKNAVGYVRPCLGKPNVCRQIVIVFDEENQ